MLLTLNVSPSTTANATITANKTTVLPGEVVVLEITDYGFPYTDERKLTVLWNLDDPLKTYSTGSGYSANIAYNPLTNKYWATQGTKNPSVQIWDENGNLAATGTIAITVEDPDAVSWTRDYTVTNTATWSAVVPASAGERVRVTIADDATIDIGSTTYTTSGANARTYITASFDGTNRPILTTSTVQHNGFDPRRNGEGFEFIIYGIHGQGTYSQKTGTGTIWSLITGGTAPTAISTLMSVAACKMTGGNLISHGGADQTYGGGLYGYSDLYVRNWLDYAINRFGEWADVTMTGCDVRADPEALRFEGGRGDNPPAAYDHCVRLGCVRKVGVEGNIIYGTGGWSTLTNDWAANPSLRIHPTTHSQTAVIFVRNNEFYNHWQTVAIGQVNSSRGFEVVPRIVALDMNTHIIGHQSRFPITIQGQPFSFQNNFCYVMAGDNGPTELNNILQLEENVIASVTAGGDALIAFNHFVSHRGGTFTDVVEQWSGSPTITKTHNVVFCPNAPNSGSFTDYTPLSAGDMFAPVNDPGGDGVSVAHAAASSGYRPRFDRDGTVRTAITDAGCYNASVSSVSAVAAPVNSVAPGAPEEMSGFADVWKLPSFGTWDYDTTNWEPYLSQTEWQSNGSPVTGSHRIFIDNRGGAYNGTTIRCLVTLTNFSGTEITATSAGTAISGAVPAFSAASTNAAGTEVYVDVSGGPISGTAATTGFTVKANGQRISLASASESADRITLVIDTGGPVLNVETLTVSYDGTGNWTNGSNTLATFTDQPVSNNSSVTADTTISGNFTADLDYSYTSGVDEIVNAYGATWNSGAPKNGGPDYPVTFRDRGGGKTTIIGGTSVGHHDLTTDWNTTYNVDSPRDNTANVMAKDTGSLTVFRNWYIDGPGWDTFRITSETGGTAGIDTFLIESCYVNVSRDDFIENDDNCAGTIRDCLFDGGFAGISFTDDRNSPTGKNVTMVGVLSRVTPYLYNGVSTHFGPCVKLSTTSMTWSATNCIFAFEKHNHRTDYVQRGWDKLSSSSNNYLLNLSDTPVSGSYPLPPSGWTFLQGSAARAKWNTEKAAWLAAHGYS